MKKSILMPLAFASLTTLSLSSCRDDAQNTGNTSVDALKPVVFAEQPAKTLSSVRTGQTRYNPANGTTEFEYLNVEEKPHTLTPLSFVDSRNTDVIYPGSMLRGESFMNGNYDPLVLPVGYNDVKLSVSLRGRNYPVKASSKPTLSEIRNTTNTLLATHQNDIDYSFVPAYVSYQADQVNTEKSFNKSLNVHANVNVLGGLVSTKFNYTDSFTSSNSQKYVMIKLHQTFYNASIDPKHYKDWFQGEVAPSAFGSHEPLYVSSVDYGRVAYLLIETNQSEEETKKMVSGAVNFAFNAVTGGVEASYNQSLRQLFAQSKIRVVIAGGPARLGGQVDSYNSFIEFIKTPSIDDLISSAAPIAYKVRRLKDNTEVEVKDVITEKVLVYKKD